jgi:methyl-accepting chemotaxis protein
VEEAAAAAEAMQNQAANLERVVSVFRVDGMGSAPQAATAVPLGTARRPHSQISKAVVRLPVAASR